MRVGDRGRLLAAALWLSCASAAGAEQPLSFSTAGGEAWSFVKRVEVLDPQGSCDEILISTTRGVLQRQPEQGRLSAVVALAAGENAIVAECRRQGVRIGEPARQHWLVRLRDVPTARVGLSMTPAGLELDASASATAPAAATPILAYDWRAGEANPAPLALPAQGPRILLQAPGRDGEYRVTLRVTDVSGRADESTLLFRMRGGEAATVDGNGEHPGWIDDAVIYGVVPKLFGPRGLADVSTRLDALAALGVNTLWLAPVTASADSDFGYAVTDHFLLRQDYGSEAELRELVAGAHARNMRVILDFVPNHLSDQHPYFQDARRHGRASPYFDFFARSRDGEATHYFNWGNLKNLDYDNEDVRQFVLEAFAHWVRNFDIDGFRVDVAWGPRQRAPDFWPRWSRELKRLKPDLLLLAEASVRDDYYRRHGFDAAYDWTDKLGVWAWESAFAGEGSVANELRQALAREADLPDRLAFRFLNNNDTGRRFISRHGPELTRVASAMLLTLPGIPGLYTGDEVGAAFEPYQEALPISWADPHGLRSWYTQLLALRRSQPALRSRALQLLELESPDKVLAYLRKDAGGGGLLVLLNYAPDPLSIELPAAVLAQLGSGSTLFELNQQQSLGDAAPRSLELAGFGVAILERR